MSNAPIPFSPREPPPQPPPSSIGTVANPPRPTTTLVGRDHEITAISAMLKRDDIQLVTLTGPGGVGKTRISIDVLNRFDGGRFDAIVFVPLAAVREPDLVPPAVAQALGVPNTTDDPIMDRISAYLQNHRTLMVLDNLEHLIESGVFVSGLIANCPSLTVLCTSRSRLNLSAEHVYPIQPLPVDASIALFVERTTALVPGFVLSTDVSTTVEAICDHVDRLPLAIELAAARSPVLPPGALLERLRHPLAMLTGGPRDAPDRQRTMRNVIAWSYQLLSKDEQVLFRRLGVFIGGFTLEAAEAVAGNGGDPLPGLETLITSSLVYAAPEVGGNPRFTMLETIRDYALEQLADRGEEPATRRLHATYFVHAIETDHRRGDGPDLRVAHDRIEAELQNCRAALAWTLETGEAEFGIRLAGALWNTWWYGQVHGESPWRERVSEGRAWLERTLAGREGLPVTVLSDALAGAVALATMQGDLDTAQAYGEELVARATAESNPFGIFSGLFFLAEQAATRMDLDAVRSLLEQARDVAPLCPDPDNHLSHALVGLGKVDDYLGNASSAAAYFEEGLAHARASENPYSVSFATANLGRFLRKQGNLHRAAVVLGEALQSYQHQRDDGGMAFCLAELALSGLAAGQAERALLLLAAADPLPFHPDDQPTYEQALATVRIRLDEPAYEAAWNAGVPMSWETVIAEIAELTRDLETPLTDVSPNGSGSTARQDGLTRREREVLLLLVDGRSNREIAEALYIGHRTATTHVTNILAKFGVETRAAAVTYAFQHDLL